MTDACQATKRILQMSTQTSTGDNYFFPLGLVRCELPAKHKGEHFGEGPVKGPEFRWPRGKQASAAFVVRPKG